MTASTLPLHVRRGAAVAAVLVGCVVPFLFGPYMVSQFTLMLIYAIAVLGLNLLVGYSGQISLGHGAFFALGAYGYAIVLDRLGLPLVVALPLVGAIGFVGGFVLGLPALRIRGHYLGLVTLAVAVATPVLIIRFDGLTGGVQGLSVPQPTAPAWSGLANDQFLYLLILAISVPLFAVAASIVRHDFGRALIAMRDNETAARTMGVDLARWKTLIFGLSAAYCAVAGGAFAFANAYVAPESFTLLLSFSFLAAVVVGGLSTIGGAVPGALFIVFVPVYASDVSDALAGVVYGAALIACMYAFRGGVMRLVEGAIAWLLGASPINRRRDEDAPAQVRA